MNTQMMKQTMALLLTLLLALSPLPTDRGAVVAVAPEDTADVGAAMETGGQGLQGSPGDPADAPEALIDAPDNPASAPGSLAAMEDDGAEPPAASGGSEDPLGVDEGAARNEGDGEPEDSGNLVPARPMMASSGALDGEDEEATYAIHITQSANGLVTPDVGKAAQGATVTLVVAPEEGYKLIPGTLAVVTDSQSAPRVVRGDGSGAAPYTFTMPNDSVTVRAQFSKISGISIADGIENGTLATNVDTAVVGERVTIYVNTTT